MDKKPTPPPRGNPSPTASTNSGKDKQKDSSTLQGCLGCFGVSVVLLIVTVFIVTLLSNDNDQPTTAQQPTRLPAASVAAKPGTALEQNVKGIIGDTVGKKNNLGGERIVSLQVKDHMGTEKTGDKIVIATLLADDAGGSTKSRMQYQAIDLFKNLFAISDIEEVTLIWQLPLVDTYGKAENSPVMKITIDRARADKINWENFNRNNFSKVANAYFEHTAIKNDK